MTKASACKSCNASRETTEWNKTGGALCLVCYRAMKAEKRRLSRLTTEGQEAIRLARAKYNAKPSSKLSHREYMREFAKVQNATPEGKAINSAKGCLWAKNNPEKAAANAAKRRAAKLKRTPLWFEKEAVDAFYANRPTHMHIDHVIPLQGEKVSGLHCLNNLQYLTAEQNHQKGNSFDEVTFIGP